MPTYEYVCAKCGHQFEKIQSISAKPLRVCPKDACGQKTWGKGKVKRVVCGGGGLLFKGSGFYSTDYRSENYKQAAKKDVPATVPSSSASAPAKPAAESKPAKATTKPAAR
jgi:putative FmdB family regulatory protein